MMQNKSFSSFAFIGVFILVGMFSISARENLEFKDVHRIMGEMLQQHVSDNKMTEELIKTSLQNYINQFDPERDYLLKAEVNELTEISPDLLKKDLTEYDNSNFEVYQNINQIIQNSIKRARQIREKLTAKPEALFQKAMKNPSFQDEGDDNEKQPFAQSVSELRERIERQVLAYISGEIKRFGDQAVMGNKKKTLEVYERFLRHRENQYLFVDDDGNPLPAQEKQNLFVMHILKALTRSLDSHSAYLNSQEAYDMKVRLEKGFHGIGIIMERKPEGNVISRLIKGAPAEKSGLVKPGDRIVKINGVNVEGYSLEELVNLLRDETKQSVFFVLKRGAAENGKTIEKSIPVTLKRELITVDDGRVDVQKEDYSGGIIGKITLHAFYQGENGVTSEKDLRKAINELKKSGNLKGIVLDLRENSGGFLNQAVKVAGLFITNGVVVVSKYSNGEEHFYRDMDGKLIFDGPLIVLTSKATASAAEIVAQALQDYGVAVVVGDERTYGKGTIQSQTVTDDKSITHFKVTVGKYYTVSGKTPQLSGVKADIVVPSHYSREHIGEEYLQHPIAPDTINSSYKDALVDIDQGLKPWYIRYYMPTLQQRETAWKDLIPALQEKSKARMSLNQSYKLALNEERGILPYQDSTDSKKDPVPDYQMKEAVNILKDMINLESKYPSRN